KLFPSRGVKLPCLLRFNVSGIRSKQERKMATQNPNRLRTNWASADWLVSGKCSGPSRPGHGLQFAADSKPPLSVIFLTDIRPPGSPAEITSPVTSKAQTGAWAASLPVARAHGNSVGTRAATTINTSSAALIYETGIFYWCATRCADSYGM